MKDKNLTLYVIVRVFLSAIFIVAGARKLLGYSGTVGYFATLGIPLPEIAVIVVAAFEIGGGVALILAWRTQYVAVALAAFTALAALIAHRFWAADAAQFGNQLIHFLKNIGMVGGFLAVLVLEAKREGATRSEPPVLSSRTSNV